MIKTRKMRTFVLGWNPSLSPYKLGDFQHDFQKIEYGDIEWQLDDWQQARSGDNFILVKYGGGNCGVVMRGFFVSAPFSVKEWNDRGDKLHMIRLRPTLMVHPDHPKGIIGLSDLKKDIPGFPWDSPSGQLLQEDKVDIFNILWRRYTTRFVNSDYGNALLDRNYHPEAGIDDAVMLACEVLYDRKGEDGRPAILDSLRHGLAATDEDGAICGFLKGVIQNTGWDAGDLRQKGFSEAVVDTLMEMRG
jgi:hypothetical protein